MPHSSALARNFARQRFGGLISLREPFAWASKSPDLAPMDYGVWPNLKMELVRQNVDFGSYDALKTVRINEFNKTDKLRKMHLADVFHPPISLIF